jgi:Ankyrin repeats (many copies)
MDIFDACHNGDWKTIKETVMKDHSLVNARSYHGWTLLQWVCYEGQFALVKFLVYNGADVRARNHSGRTALQLTLKRSVRLYLEKQPVREVLMVLCRSHTIPHDLVRALCMYVL